MFVKQNQSKEIRPIVNTIKKIIKDKKKDSPIKLISLKLLNACLTQSQNEEFLMYFEKKILRRLSLLARFKKESTDLEKGQQLFGKTYFQQASSDFLKLLLLFLQKWSVQFQSYPSSGKPTETLKVFQSLLKEKIHFPSEEAIMQSLGGNSKESQDLKGSKSQGNGLRNSQQFMSNSNHSQGRNSRQQLEGVNYVREDFKSNQVSSSNNPLRQSLSTNSMSNQPQSRQTPKPQKVMTAEEAARKFKDDYKKLMDYHNNAKLCEEILQMNDDPSQLDSELLIEFRNSLTEGKNFVEDFLQQIMDSEFQFKDKDQKIEKILGIISFISTQLEKILIFKPYSPKSQPQANPDKRNSPDNDNNVQKKNKKLQPVSGSQQQQRGINPQEKTPVVGNRGSVTNKERLEAQQQQNVQEFSSIDPQHNSSSQPASNDFAFDQSIFKTNFAMSSAQNNNANNDFDWGMSSQQFGTGQGIQSQFGNNFNSFNPIASSFDFNMSSKRDQKEQNPFSTNNNFIVKDTLIEQQNVQEQIAQKTEVIQKSSLPFYNKSNEKQKSDEKVIKEEEVKVIVQPIQKEIKEEEVKLESPETQKQVNRRQSEKIKTSSATPNLQMPSSVKPGLINKIPQNPPTGSQSPMDSFFSFPVQTPQILIANNDQEDSQTSKSKVNDIQLGMTQKIQIAKRPSITQQSPDIDEDHEDEEEFQVQQSNDKSDFKFPSPSQNQMFSQHNHPSPIQDFGWDFNQSAVQNKNQQQNQNPSSVQKTQALDSFSVMKKSSSQIKTQSMPPPLPIPQTRQSLVSQPKRISSDLKFHEDPHKDQQSPAKFDFNMEQEESTHEQIKQQVVTVVDTKEIDKLKEQIKDILGKNEGLIKKNDALYQQLKDQNTQTNTLLDKCSDLTHKLSVLQSERLDLIAKLEAYQQDIKQLKESLQYHDELKEEKKELQRIVKQLEERIEDQIKSGDRMEYLVNKKDKEIDQLEKHIDDYKQAIEEIREQNERDLTDLKKSEAETKKQLQNELLDSRKREEDLKLLLQKESHSSLQKLETLRLQHQSQLLESHNREDALLSKCTLLEEQKDKEIQELKNRIQEMETQMTRRKSSGKIMVNKDSIRFKREQSEKTPSSHKNIEEKSESENGLSESPQLFTSYIKSEQQQRVFANPISNFEVQVLESDENKEEIGVQQDSQQNNKIQQLQIPLKESMSEKSNDISREERMGNIPSSDSDRSQSLNDNSQQDQNTGSNPFDLIQNTESVITGQINHQQPDVQSKNPYKRESPVSDIINKINDQQQVTVLDQEEETKQSQSEQQKQKQQISAIQEEKKNFQEIEDFWSQINEIKKVPEQNKNQDEIKSSLIENNLDSINIQSKLIEESKVQQHQQQQNPAFDLDSLLGIGNQQQIENQQIRKQSQEDNSIKEAILFKPQAMEQQDQPQFNKLITPDKDKKELGQTQQHQQTQQVNSQQFQTHQPISQPVHYQTNQSQNQISHQYIPQQQQFATNTPVKKSPPPFNINNNQTPLISNNQQTSQSFIQPQQTIQQPLNSMPVMMTPRQPPQQQQMQMQSPQNMLNSVNQQRSPQDIKIDQSQFSTVNTEQYHKLQQTQQQQQPLTLDPMSLIRQQLFQSFRKALLSNKCVVLEDQCLQVGMVSDLSIPGMARMRMFFGCKQPHLEAVQVSLNCQPSGYEIAQSRNVIPMLNQGQQETIDVQMKVNSFQFQTPVYNLTYKQSNGQQTTQPLRLPMILLKVCSALPQLDSQGFTFKWNFECSPKTEVKQMFNIDFNQCRSLSQLKETLQLGKNTFIFVENAEGQLKNMVYCATQFSINPNLQAFIKITVSVTGQACEISGRSSDHDDSIADDNQFVKFVISNIIDIIALKGTQF